MATSKLLEEKNGKFLVKELTDSCTELFGSFLVVTPLFTETGEIFEKMDLELMASGEIKKAFCESLYSAALSYADKNNAEYVQVKKEYIPKKHKHDFVGYYFNKRNN